MIKKIFTLFKIARTLAVSDALKIIYKFHKPPLFIRVFFKIFSISFDKTNSGNMNISDEERLCKSIQSMESGINHVALNEEKDVEQSKGQSGSGGSGWRGIYA